MTIECGERVLYAVYKIYWRGDLGVSSIRTKYLRRYVQACNWLTMVDDRILTANGIRALR